VEQRTELDVIPNPSLESVDSVTPHDGPDLEGAETAREGILPFSIAVTGCFSTKSLRRYEGCEGKRIGEVAAAFDEYTATTYVSLLPGSWNKRSFQNVLGVEIDQEPLAYAEVEAFEAV
jgi:hypothetical protein